QGLEALFFAGVQPYLARRSRACGSRQAATPGDVTRDGSVPTPANPNLISYEYPLSERVRTLLRLEDLYRKAWYFTAKSESVENHVALVLLFDILEVAGRADLKSDLLQELERQRQSLESLRDNPAISLD